MSFEERLNALTMNLELFFRELEAMREKSIIEMQEMREKSAHFQESVNSLLQSTANLLKTAESRERRLIRLEGSAA
jgi:hypothetical protein